MKNGSSTADICINARQARHCFHNGNYPAAHRLFVDIFKLNPKAWWLAMEALRSLRVQRVETNVNHISSGHILFSPNYTMGNSYQSNLYSEAKRFSYKVAPIDALELDALPTDFDFSGNNVFHQHWIKEFYWHAKSFDEGVAEVQRRISVLKAFKAFGIKVAWTLHNLIDHDATDLQKELCIYTHRKMAKVSDIIYVHTLNSGRLLSEQCGWDLTTKSYLLEHPLYDDFLSIGDPVLPKEIDSIKLKGKKVLVCLGMIKPYKGVPELLKAFDQYSRKYPHNSLFLIIGGKVYDSVVKSAMDQLDEFTRGRLILIDRRLSDAEMSALLRLANASITPYRKILISGSFYLSTTFGKPTIAPNLGMFQELIKDGETGFLYDGTVDGLTDSLRRISEVSNDHLAKIGDSNLAANKHLTITAISERYFKTLGIPNE